MSSGNTSSDKAPRATSHLEALLHGRTLLGIAMFAIFAVMVGIASGYPWQAAMLPVVIGVPGMLLSALQVVLDIRGYHRAEGKMDPRTAFEIYMDEINEGTKGQVQMDLGTTAKELTTLVEDPSTVGRTRAQRERLLWAYFYGLILLVLLFGFWIGMTVFLAAFLRFYARESWRLTAILTLACWLSMYVLLVVALQQVLFEGFLTGYVMETWFPS
jgi:hypothetical protein